ncbi:hypothetical protein [Flagellimonas sp.]|uniref:hypothetical protein n=1 Tax=Flagellimonas sp. TaxID=2058762 RepID=UPI003B500C83
MALTLTFIACSGEDGEDGLTGLNGINCWDLNANGINDANEDTNADGKWDIKDCQGTKGDTGGDGNNGDNGNDGINCWDLDADGINDPEEDINGDEKFDGLDCQGADGDPGTNGDNGNDGIDCWDLNGNGKNDAEEDINGDKEFNALDCQGADGNANVIQYTEDVSDLANFSEIPFNLIDDLGIAAEDLPNYTFLFYFSVGGSYVIPAPNKFNFNGYKDIVVFYDEFSGDGSYEFLNHDGSAFNVIQGIIDEIRIVAIENSVVINKNGNGDVMAQLKAAGVDTSDYYAVLAYFGLKE